jgi:hypothetical protein
MPTSKINDFKTKAINVINKIKPVDTNSQITIVIVSIFALLIIGSFVYIRNKMTLSNQNCKNINSIYKNFPPIASLSNTSDKKYNLRDYYIKTAYNSCCSGNFKDDFVDLCALENCIKQGARCLDFQIYSLNDVPVIAASSLDDFSIKETYNSILFTNAMNTIKNMAFTASGCPNFNDPLILHFRISSNNQKIYTEMANTIHSVLGEYILGREYINEYNGNNLSALPIETFFGKIIISVNKENPLFQQTPLDEYVNITSGGAFMRQLRYKDVLYTHDLNFAEFNKKNMTISIPDLSPSDTNQSFAVVQKYGCQFCAMNFQNYDSNMEYYDLFFSENGHAFVLKPEDLRFIPVTIPKPPPAPKENSYKPRPIKSDFYNFHI